MPDEEIRIVVKQDTQGSALKDANKDAEKLQQTLAKPATNPWTTAANAKPAPYSSPAPASAPASRPGGTPWQPAPMPGAAPASAATKKAHAQMKSAATRAAHLRNLQMVDDAQQDLLDAQSKGAPAAHIQGLKDQLRERKLVARFMRTQGMSEPDAISKAQGMVAAHNGASAQTAATKAAAIQQAAAVKAAAVAQQAAQKAAATQQAAAVKAAAQQQAVAKAQQAHLMRAGRAVARSAGNLAGSSGLGGLTSAAGAFGPAAIAAAAVAAVTYGVVAAFQTQRDAIKMIGLEDKADRAKSDYRINRMGSFEGTAESNAEEFRNSRQDEEDRKKDRAVLAEKARFKWNDRSTWLPWLTGAAGNAQIENENKIRNDATDAEKEKEQAKQKYNDYVAPLIAASKARLAGDPQGARAKEDEVTRKKAYDENLKQRAVEAGKETDEDKAIANDAADTKMAEVARERAGNFAKLVTARSSASAGLRIAALAEAQYVRSTGHHSDGSAVAGAVDRLHDTVRDQAFHAHFRNFSKGPSSGA